MFQKTLPVATIGGDLVHHRATTHQQQMRETLAQLARFGVAQEDGIAGREPL